MRSLYAFDTGHCTAMNSSTVPFFPASDLSEWSLLSTSGSVKSSIVAPIAGGAGPSRSTREPTAEMAPAITNSDANRIDRFLVFIYKISFNATRLCNQQITQIRQIEQISIICV